MQAKIIIPSGKNKIILLSIKKTKLFFIIDHLEKCLNLLVVVQCSFFLIVVKLGKNFIKFLLYVNSKASRISSFLTLWLILNITWIEDSQLS